MSYMYDLYCLPARLKTLRKDKWKLYSENPDREDYKKYSCCKTVESFAIEINVERRTIGNWEKGKSIPSLENIIKICDLLDCQIDYLLGVSDISEIDPFALANKYSGISVEIIKESSRNSHYCDFLNFFMKPDTCKGLIDSFEAISWAEYWKKNQLSITNIKEEAIQELENYYYEFCCYTPYENDSLKEYKKFLAHKLPKIENNKKIKFKKYLKVQIYTELLSDKTFDEAYPIFIDYLAEQTYDLFRHNVIIQIKKENLRNDFLTIHEKYVSAL